jgi:flagella basal body P-ring formation protein FlgA
MRWVRLVSWSLLAPAFAVALALAEARAAVPRVASESPAQPRQRVEAAALQAQASRGLSDWLARQPVSRFEVSPASPVADVDVPAGPWSLSTRPLAAGQAPVGRTIVWVEVRVADRVEKRVLEKRVPVVMMVRSFAPRWQARIDLPARAAVGPEGFERQEVELSLPYLPAPADLPMGARLTRALAKGQVLQAAHLEQAIEVTRGDLVDAHVRRGLVNVQTRGEALQDGRQGQRVQVRITGATGPVQALVVGPGAVQANE